MNITKLLIMIIFFVFFADMCMASEYYCGDAMKNYNHANLYDSSKTAEQKCQWLLTDIIMSDKPMTYTYQQCVNNFNAAKAKYDKGMCTPVITNNHIYKDNKSKKDIACRVDLVKNTPVVVRTSCDINDKESSETAMDINEAAMFYFGKLYRRQYGIYEVE